MIHGLKHSVPVQVLVDSGADDNFIDSNFVKSHDIPTYELSSPKEVHAVDGKLLELVTHKTEPLKLLLSSNHHKHLELCYFFTSELCHSGNPLAQATQPSRRLVHCHHPQLDSLLPCPLPPLRLASQTYRLHPSTRGN